MAFKLASGVENANHWLGLLKMQPAPPETSTCSICGGLLEKQGTVDSAVWFVYCALTKRSSHQQFYLDARGLKSA
jgi:hypothetical protein